MYRAIHSTSRLSEIPLVLFSLRLSGDQELLESAKPMAEPLVLGPETAQMINESFFGFHWYKNMPGRLSCESGFRQLI